MGARASARRGTLGRAGVGGGLGASEGAGAGARGVDSAGACAGAGAGDGAGACALVPTRKDLVDLTGAGTSDGWHVHENPLWEPATKKVRTEPTRMADVLMSCVPGRMRIRDPRTEDGNCFFHALGKELQRVDPERWLSYGFDVHKVLRMKLAAYVSSPRVSAWLKQPGLLDDRRNRSTYLLHGMWCHDQVPGMEDEPLSTVEEYQKYIAEDGNWVCNIDIDIMAHLIKPIRLFTCVKHGLSIGLSTPSSYEMRGFFPEELVMVYGKRMDAHRRVEAQTISSRDVVLCNEYGMHYEPCPPVVRSKSTHDGMMEDEADDDFRGDDGAGSDMSGCTDDEEGTRTTEGADQANGNATITEEDEERERQTRDNELKDQVKKGRIRDIKQDITRWSMLKDEDGTSKFSLYEKFVRYKLMKSYLCRGRWDRALKAELMRMLNDKPGVFTHSYKWKHVAYKMKGRMGDFTLIDGDLFFKGTTKKRKRHDDNKAKLVALDEDMLARMLYEMYEEEGIMGGAMQENMFEECFRKKYFFEGVRAIASKYLASVPQV